MLVNKHPLMKALRRSQTSLASSKSMLSPSSTSSPSSSAASSSSWIHLRSVLLIVASSSSSSPVSSNRGNLKSPWSRRRRKHALLAKQWKNLFDADGKFLDGGIKFLKKIRTGGVEPSIRAEVWPFLLGMYDVKSSEKQRDVIVSQKRRSYLELRRQCYLISRHGERSFKLKEISGNSGNKDGGDTTQVLDSGLDEISGARPSISMEITTMSANAVYKDIQNVNYHTPIEFAELEEDCAITETKVSDAEMESSDSDSSEELEDMKPLLSSTDDGDNHLYERIDSTLSKLERMPTFQKNEDFATWQRIIRLDAIRVNSEWIRYSSQAAVSEAKARQLAESVGLKDYDSLEPCQIHHAARLVAILEAYAVYDSETGYCQGMSDLLSPIVSVIEEDHIAFWCFVGFMRKARHNFRLDEVGIRRQLSIVSKIIKCKDTLLYKHLEKLQAEDCFFVYRMVVVLFRRELTFEQTLCLWEVMWADQAAIRAGIVKPPRRKMRLRAPPTEDLLLYAIAACVLQKRKLFIENYSSMDEIVRECNNLAGHLDVWKLLDDAHDLVVTLHDKI
ncbi:rab GTPase-activating protein 22-like isoform X1 [Andrographis paniculata]|uniref:rab GTPase-activating protein 22-like isoform X1 n=1 Tax=Andrographis paniculata TaxID=175694 RepID=UPI0021E8B65C|nr:rab GTPase-activating protein 22-like isoform X1 [Andrographis paniculata]